jgi:acyl-CoA synthetase (AMP-forming)/AMP-acid ligase II/acyl carrier protein
MTDHKHAASARTLVELLRWRAQHQPDRLAYRFLTDGEIEEEQLTYRQLDERARALAAQLQQRSAPGSRALMLYPPGADFVVAFFGCLYANIVAMPLYPPHRARLSRNVQRILSIVRDSQPALTLTTADSLDTLEAAAGYAPELRETAWISTDAIPATLADEWEPPAIDGETLAFLQYSSGSTGAPKGVMVSHRNLLHNSALINQGVGITPEITGVTWLPVYHDMGLIGGILQPLYAGFTMAVMSPVAFLQSPVRWLQAISRYRADLSVAPNFAYELCVQRITAEQRAQLDLRSWTIALNGAEPVRPETIARFSATFAACGFRPETFMPCYGLAEATLFVSSIPQAEPPTAITVDSAALEQNRVETAHAEAEGRALASSGIPCQQRVAIVDPATLRECTADAVGEIWVCGPSVAQGYWRRPEQTAATFQARIADTDEGPFLRTGDLGFVRDGYLFVTGRLKDLIIIRGRNHYPQDIEYTVEQSHPAIRAGCGAAFSVEIDGGERLVIVQEIERQYRSGDTTAIVQAIRQAVAEQHELHAYAVALVKPGSIPKTTSGKIQRHACRSGFLSQSLEIVSSDVLDDAGPAMPDDQLTRPELLALPSAARDARLASFLINQIARVMSIPAAQIDPHQPVSMLGLDSLMAVELKHRIEQQLGVALSLAAFLQHWSVAELTEALLKQLQSLELPAPAAIARASRAQLLPSSFAQEQLWIQDQLDPGSAAYNIPVALRLVGRLDLGALERSLNAVIQRHDALRTSFATVHEMPVQIVAAQLALPLPLIDLRALPESERRAEAQRLARVHAQQRFDLGVAPLLAAQLIQHADDDYQLLLTMHHIISDGWSMGVLLREIAACYAALVSGRAPEPPELTIQYPDYAIWQRERLQGETLATEQAYWKRRLSGAPALSTIPSDQPRPAVQTANGATQTLMLSGELSARLETLSQQQGVTLFMTLMAAFQLVQSELSGQSDLVTGTDAANRGQPETEGLIGFFVNQLVIRTDLAAVTTFPALLQQVRATMLEAYDHQELPFDKLIEAVSPPRRPDHAPIFQVKLVQPIVPARDIELPGLRLCVDELIRAYAEDQKGTAQIDLNLRVVEHPAGLVLSAEYNTDLYQASTIVRLLRAFEAVLRAVSSDPAAELNVLRATIASVLRDEQRRAQEERQALRQQQIKQIKRRPLQGASVTQETSR